MEYTIEGDHATIHVRPDASSLAGALKSDKGHGLTLDEVRRIAAENDRARLKREYGPGPKRGKLLICHFNRPKAK